MQKEYEEFDFTKKMKNTVAKVEKQSYAKLSFLMIGCAALLFGGYTISNIILDKFKIESMGVQQKKQLLVRDIKEMNENEFSNMLDYVSKNVSIYDSKVTYVQEVIVKADDEERNTMGTHHAVSLGKLLTKYKNTIGEDVAKLMIVRKSVTNNIEVQSEDIDKFFKYMGAYKSKLILNDEKIDDMIHKLIYDTNSGNQRYNKKNSVYEKIKFFDNELKKFEFVESKTISQLKM